MIKLLPDSLYDLVSYAYPSRAWIAFEKHSDYVYTIYVQKPDDVLVCLRACLSLDRRWTLTPSY